jgi:demethylmenaquinone methyltransferase/2-methoxy-6-polyprenyl-1,4-benzoquinol methylase
LDVDLDDCETRRRYDETPEAYDRRYAAIQRAKYPSLLDMLSPEPGQRVLDWGCGTGLARLALDDAGCFAVGVDFSLGMLRRAADRGQGRLVLASCSRLPFRGESFARLLGATVIQNVQDKDRALAEISRTLRKGGIAVISYPRNALVKVPAVEAYGMRKGERRAVGEDTALSLIKLG